jgi:RNA polymerase sigma factor (TIGR02999 family)
MPCPPRGAANCCFPRETLPRYGGGEDLSGRVVWRQLHPKEPWFMFAMKSPNRALGGMASTISQVLSELEEGAAKAEELLPLIYDELRRLAAVRLAQERPGQTLQATALVHEAWLRVSGGSPQVQWQGRRHFFGAAAEAMRRILVENARRKRRLKHGGGWQRVDLENIEMPLTMPDEDLMVLDEALSNLANSHPEAAELVKLCFFAGLTQAQAAQELGISRATAERTWTFARAWLFREMKRLR